MNPTASSHARASAHWALKRVPVGWLANWWGDNTPLSKSRVSHKRKDGDNEVARSLALTEHPSVDGAAILTAHMEAFERRCIREAERDRKKLAARLTVLLSREHDKEAQQNRALQAGGRANDAIRDHVADLLEIAALRALLGHEADA